MTDEWKAMDEWCAKHLAKLSQPMADHVMQGIGLNDPQYRRWLGEHIAFSRMRSFIHGALVAERGK